jgi:hypothetical protein
MGWRRWVGALLLAPTLLAAAALLAPLGPPVDPRVAYGLAYLAVSVETLAATALSPRLPLRALGLLAPAVAAVALAPCFEGLSPILAAAAVTVGLLLAGATVGGVVGELVEAPGQLLVVAVLSGLVDAFSVLHPQGVSAQVVESASALQVLVLPWPMLGTSRIDPILGVGDVAFCGLYLGVVRKFGLSTSRTVAGLAFGLALTLGVVVVAAVAIPALPFLGLGVLALVPEARRLPKKDRRAAAVGLGLLLLALVVVLMR